jgi:hypothetical protein
MTDQTSSASQVENDILMDKVKLTSESTYPMRQKDSGEIHNVFGDSVKRYLEQGFSLVPDEALKINKSVKDSGVIGQAAVALGAAANSILLGAPKTAMEYIAPESMATKVMEEGLAQNPELAVGGEVAGVIASIPETVLAAPAKVLIKASDAVASKIGLGKILGLGGETVAKSISGNLEAKGIGAIAGEVAAKTAQAAGRGAVHGAALTLPSASIQAAFGDANQAAESMFFGTGIGSFLEGGGTGLFESVKSIPQIGKSVSKAIEGIYGKGANDIANDANSLSSELAARAELEHRANIQRMSDTLKALDIPVEALPPEAVFTDEAQLREASKSEGRKIPFVDENEIARQRKMIELAIQKKYSEEIIPKLRRYAKALEKSDSVGSKRIDDAIQLFEKVGEASALYRESIIARGENFIQNVNGKFSGLSESQIAEEIEKSFQIKADSDFVPVRDAMRASDDTIRDINISNRGSGDSSINGLDPQLKVIVDQSVAKIELDPFESEYNRKAIAQGHANLKNLGFKYENGFLFKKGEKVNNVDVDILKAKEESYQKFLNEYKSGKHSNKKMGAYKEFARMLKNRETGAELIELEMSARRLKNEYYSKDTELALAYGDIVETLDGLSDKIKTIVGGESSVVLKKNAMAEYKKLAEKWGPVLKAIRGSSKELSIKDAIGLVQSGEMKGKFLNTFDKNNFHKNEIISKHFQEELRLSAGYAISKLAKKHTFGETKDYYSFFKKLEHEEELVKTSLDQESQSFIKRMTSFLSKDNSPEKEVIKRILKKSDSPEKVFTEIKQLDPGIQKSIFGEKYESIIAGLERHFERVDVRTSIRKLEQAIENKNLEFDVEGLTKELMKMPKSEQMRVFGVSGKELIENVNHLLGFVKVGSKARAGEKLADLIESHATIAGIGKKFLVGVKNIFDISRIQTEKQRIIDAALNTEKELQVKNAARATLENQKVLKRVEVFFDDFLKKGKGSSFSVMGIASKKDEKDEYHENLELLRKITSSKAFIVSEAASKSQVFSAIPDIHLEYMNRLQQTMSEIQGFNSLIGTKKNKFFKLKDHPPSKNEMFMLNKKMGVIKNPYSVVEDFSRGVVNPESMRIANSVYPSTMKNIRKVMMEKIIDKNDLVMPYKDRINLSLFLGTDLDGTIGNIDIFSNNSMMAHNQDNQNIKNNLQLDKVSMASPVQQIGEV